MLTKITIKILYTFFPFAILIWLSPFVIGSFVNLPEALSRHDFYGIFTVAIPIYLGLLASPAYLYLLFSEVKKQSITIRKQFWIRISLVIGMLCTIYGFFMGYMLPLLSPLCVIVFLMCLHLWIRFEKGK